MKFLKQTKLGKNGNCFDACIASLLEIPIEEVNYFKSPETWYNDLQEWLKPRGYFYLEVTLETKPYPLYGLPDVVCIMCGKTNRSKEIEHAVLGKIKGTKVEIIFDPHPSNEGLIEINAYGFLVKRIE